MAIDSLWPLSQGKFYLNISKMHFSKKMAKPWYREAITFHLWSSSELSQKSPEQPDLVLWVLLWAGWIRLFQRSCPIVNLLQQMHVSYLLPTEIVTEKQCFCSTTHAITKSKPYYSLAAKGRQQALMLSFLFIYYNLFQKLISTINSGYFKTTWKKTQSALVTVYLATT